jgi:hypothetical protein
MQVNAPVKGNGGGSGSIVKHGKSGSPKRQNSGWLKSSRAGPPVRTPRSKRDFLQLQDLLTGFLAYNCTAPRQLDGIVYAGSQECPFTGASGTCTRVAALHPISTTTATSNFE